ncbi:putative nicotinate-nucleotide pyrophosphorylase [carboxylating] [bacterium HR11]|nr:putative nicotinate-nucleotide pyrophosphorylase [carboxylating] [bacterium HR11]
MWDYAALFGKTVAEIDDLLRAALAEDAPYGDVTTRRLIPPDRRARGVLRARRTFVLAGLPLFERVFYLITSDVQARWFCEDGATVVPEQEIGHVEGPAHALLMGERTALNLLQRLSGIATLTRRMVEAVRPYPVAILDTRKTTPLWRWAEKYAVRVGGGTNHRMSLSDGLLIKDNHLALIGGIEGLAGLRDALFQEATGLEPEVEVRSLEELQKVLALGFRRILLDNMSPDQVRQAVQMTQGRAWLEVSGGVTIDNVQDYAATGVDAISVGALTHSAPAADAHFKVYPL